MKNVISFALAYSALSITLTGCGKSASVEPGATVQSQSFSRTGFSALGGFLAAAPAASIDTFKICVKRIRLDDPDGESKRNEGETGDDGEANPDDIRFAPGLIDLGDGTAKSWGKVTIPTGFQLSRIRIKVKKDRALCGTDYSVKLNEFEDVRDIEFRFKLEPAVAIDSDSPILTLSFRTVVDALKTAIDGGHLTGNKIKEAVEAAEGAATKE